MTKEAMDAANAYIRAAAAYSQRLVSIRAMYAQGKRMMRASGLRMRPREEWREERGVEVSKKHSPRRGRKMPQNDTDMVGAHARVPLSRDRGNVHRERNVAEDARVELLLDRYIVARTRTLIGG